MLQVLCVICEPLVARAFVNHVPRKAHVAEADLLALQLTL